MGVHEWLADTRDDIDVFFSSSGRRFKLAHDQGTAQNTLDRIAEKFGFPTLGFDGDQ